MKIAAHPLVVAVALGLVAPEALEERATDGTTGPRAVDHSPAAPDLAAHHEAPATEWSPAELPSAEELHRVELEWLKTTS